MKPRARTLALVAAALIGLSVFVGPATTANARTKNRIEVVTAFYPLAEAVQRVGGNNVRVTNLTPPGAEPHDLELTTDQVDEIQDARLVVVMGKGFQPAVEKVASDRDGVTVVVLRDVRATRPDDPHVWLDPVRMRDIVDVVKRSLVRVDRKHAAAYLRQAEAFDAELAQLDADYQAGLSQCTRRTIVSAHDAFGYLTDRYRLRQVSIAGVSPDAEPNPKRLAELTDLVRRERVTTVFAEELVSPKLAQTLAREAGVTTDVLNPLEGLTDDERADGANYVSVMRSNLAKLRTALNCA